MEVLSFLTADKKHMLVFESGRKKTAKEYIITP